MTIRVGFVRWSSLLGEWFRFVASLLRRGVAVLPMALDDLFDVEYRADLYRRETLYAAFEPVTPGGKHLLYQWSLPESNARHVPDSVSHTCMADKCGRHFGLLEPKRHCGGCGGVFCGTHAVHVESFNHRYCDECRSQLSYASATGILSNRRDSARPTSRPVSRRGSVSASRPGSRRPSVSFALGGVAQGSGSGTGVGIGQGLQASNVMPGATGGGGTPQLHGNTKLGVGFSTPMLGP
jgi:hypothetical protein